MITTSCRFASLTPRTRERLPRSNNVATIGLPSDDSHHHRGYTYLFVGGNASYRPTFTYTWKQAVKDGAGTNTYDPGPSPRALCNVPFAMGLMLAGASRAIEKAHCSVGEVVRKHADYAPGVVFQQYPAPGKTLARGSSVRLSVSLGPS